MTSSAHAGSQPPISEDGACPITAAGPLRCGWWAAAAAPQATKRRPSSPALRPAAFGPPPKPPPETDASGASSSASQAEKPVVQALVNGALLRVAAGGGVRVTNGPLHDRGASPATCLHIVCLTPGGCTVRVAGRGVRSLSFGEAASFPCAHGEAWVAFGAPGAQDNPAQAAKTEPGLTAEAGSGQQQHHDAPATTKPLSSFRWKWKRACLRRLAGMASDGGNPWRSCATSFSTMVRFLSRHSDELTWRRPLDGNETVVTWTRAPQQRQHQQ